MSWTTSHHMTQGNDGEIRVTASNAYRPSECAQKRRCWGPLYHTQLWRKCGTCSLWPAPNRWLCAAEHHCRLFFHQRSQMWNYSILIHYKKSVVNGEFIYLLTYLLIFLLACLPARLLTGLRTRLRTHLLTHSFIHLLKYTCYLLTHSFIHLITYTCLLTYSRGCITACNTRQNTK